MNPLALALALALTSPPPPQAIPAPPTASPPPPAVGRVDELLARLPLGPSLEEVHAAALRRAAIAPESARRWLLRARAAAALPSLQAELDLKIDQGWKLAQEAGSADELSQDLGAARVIRVKAAWSLDRLIFSPEEVRAARALIDAGVAREQLLVRITQLYFERVDLLARRELDPPDTLGAALADELRIREIEALLGGITGLRFRP